MSAMIYDREKSIFYFASRQADVYLNDIITFFESFLTT